MSTLKQKAEQIQTEKDNNIVPENIRNGVQIFDVEGTYQGSGSLDLSTGIKFGGSGFNELPSSIVNANWNEVYNIQAMFSGCSNLRTVPSLNIVGENVNDTSSMFSYCSSLTSVALFDTSNCINMRQMFSYCQNLISIPAFNTSSAIDMNGLFYFCMALTTIPQLDTSSVTEMGDMFYGCNSLSNESLNNILAMCVSASSYTGTKTLKYLKITSAQATICQGLSNYQDFINAGWTTGY